MTAPPSPLAPPQAHQGAGITGRQIAQTLKAREDAKSTAAERLADRVTAGAGSVGFFVANAIWFIAWIAVNTGLLPVIPPFDPFPFGLLTMIVSLEAIGLAILVLISQNRAERVSTLRQETDLLINAQTEAELTKLLQLSARLLEHAGIDVSGDQELQAMLRPTDLEEMEAKLEEEIGS